MTLNVDDDMLISYALGSLAPEEERRVEAHLRAHPKDAAKVRAYLESLVDFALRLEPVPVSPEDEAALLKRVRLAQVEVPPPVISAPRRPRRVWWLGLAAAAAVLGGLYLSVFIPTPEERIAELLEDYENRPGAQTYELTSNQDGRAGERIGTLVRLRDNRLFVALEAPPAEARVYQAWEIRGETPVSLGTFEERAFLVERPVAPQSVFGLTLEPPGGSKQPTTVPLTLVEL